MSYGYFVQIMGYFEVWCLVTLGYMAFHLGTIQELRCRVAGLHIMSTEFLAAGPLERPVWVSASVCQLCH